MNQGGITIQKRQPNFTLLVDIVSPDGSVDPLTLSNYAYSQLVDPTKRLPGASDVTIFGEKRYSMRFGSTRTGWRGWASPRVHPAPAGASPADHHAGCRIRGASEVAPCSIPRSRAAS